MDESMVTRRRYANLIQFLCFVSSLEPKNLKEALMDEAWIQAIQEELDQFIHNKVWMLVPRPTCANAIEQTGFSKTKVMSLVKQSDDGTFVSQSKYAKNLVKKFGLENAKHINTPMSTTLKLSKDEQGVKVEPTLYRSMIGNLLYLIASRPNICYSVGVCARYQGNPMESHISIVKRIIRYVNSTVDFGIWFSKDTNSNLVCFSDTDWAKNAYDRKSTNGGCFYIGNNLVSGHSKKQSCISLLTAEAEYIAAGSCCTQFYG
ncbi:uncharacterized mitochondrial protein AtMg00810-like [Humulus lupulus]|uniref:uncharacterized mitochondrial protein AtMg00810-like n=1 Tax=Humulus lupulus TaxID=3486 RepID=UPI002B413A9F|nr:uncharacterized mitochondrial protein AtMg00810-like [Humulus lupulus]